MDSKAGGTEMVPICDLNKEGNARSHRHHPSSAARPSRGHPLPAPPGKWVLVNDQMTSDECLDKNPPPARSRFSQLLCASGPDPADSVLRAAGEGSGVPAELRKKSSEQLHPRGGGVGHGVGDRGHNAPDSA